jgi:hypothetical protein
MMNALAASLNSFYAKTDKKIRTKTNTFPTDERTNRLPDYQSNHEEDKKVQISKILMHILVISM